MKPTDIKQIQNLWEKVVEQQNKAAWDTRFPQKDARF